MKRLLSLLITVLIALPAVASATFTDTKYDPKEETLFFPDEPAAISAPAPRVDPANDTWPKTIVVTVGGDCTIGTTDAQRKRSDGFDAIVKEKGYAWPFSGLVSLFETDDLTLVNLEGPLTDSTDKYPDKLFNFKGPAEYAQILTLGSVEAVNLANNHFHDYKEQGKQDTLAALEAVGILGNVEGTPVIYETRGVKIGLIGNTFSYTNGKRDITADVKQLRDAGCQIVIASFHWGSEYETAYSRDQRNIGRAAVKAGADVVVGHHPHIIQGIELYEDRYILYSLGNLVFGGNTSPDSDKRDAYVAQLTFVVQENGDTAPPTLRIIPVRLTEQKNGTDYRPVIFTEGETYDRILKLILNRSENMKNFVNPTN